jgi:hypothetical protein
MFGLSGYARAGKDTVANILIKEHGFERIAYADALRGVAKQINPIVSGGEKVRLSDVLDTYGWEGAKDTFPEVREFLQRLGVTLREVIDEDVWVNLAFRNINTYDDDARYVVPDMRFPNEMGAVRFVGGATVRIERPGYGPVNGHISETALDNARFDYTIHNDGTLHRLEHAVAAMVAEEEHTDREPFV